MWQKGQSGNPGGKNAKTEDDRIVDYLIKRATPHCIRRLVNIAKDDAAPVQSQVTAAIYLIDRHMGKPTQTVNANVKGQYWIADNPITADEWAFEFAPKPDETTVQ